ncbi:MAG: DNA replication/repair protein RecF [bacterium]
MRFQKVRLTNFRNYRETEFKPAPGMNLLLGANAQGKSNLIEALYVFAMSRSFRTRNEQEVLTWGEPCARVEAQIQRARDTITSDVSWTAGDGGRISKIFHLNSSPLRKLSDFIGQVQLVLFAPEDLQVVKGPPHERRRFLDFLLARIYPEYLFSLQQYRRVLRERNLGLRDRRARHAQLDEVWREQLAQWGGRLLLRRIRALKAFSVFFQATHRQMSGQEALIRYSSSIPLPEPLTEEGIRASFLRKMEHNLRQEEERGATLTGPHRDDFSLLRDGREMRSFSSQGEQRTAALTLKMAEGEFLLTELGEEPAWLLDDALSELDEKRQELLLDFLSGKEQVILSSSVLPPALERHGEKISQFEISSGEIHERTSHG